MRQKRCICGFLADVDEWNARGIVMYCRECGAFDLKRDELYEMGLESRIILAYLDRWKKQWKADSEDGSIDDEAYKSACQMAVEMADEMFRGLRDMEQEWRDEKREEVDYLYRRNGPEQPVQMSMRPGIAPHLTWNGFKTALISRRHNHGKMGRDARRGEDGRDGAHRVGIGKDSGLHGEEHGGLGG